MSGRCQPILGGGPLLVGQHRIKRVFGYEADFDFYCTVLEVNGCKITGLPFSVVRITISIPGYFCPFIVSTGSLLDC
jgi:hypothetical protein